MLIFGSVLALSCDKGAMVEPTEPVSTFESIQQTVFDKNCATSGCHNSEGRAGGLVLQVGQAFGNLINVVPTNTYAKSANYYRVRPNRPDSSFLFLKLDLPLSPDFGTRMPLNTTTPLPANYREFIRQWIAAGAPQTGFVADERLIADPIVSNDTFTPLEPPTQGMQLRVRPFAVNPATEREIFVYGRISNPDSMFVNRFEIKMRPGSHHFIVYKYGGTDLLEWQPRDLNPTNPGQEIFRAERQLFVGSQTPVYDYQLPANVVLSLAPSQGFDLNSHYVNSKLTVSTGEVYINLHTISKTDSTHIAQPIFDNYLPFLLPKKQKTIVTYTWTKNFSRNVFMLSSHTHKRGESFKIYRVGGSDDGMLIYENYDWDHPPSKTFTPPLRFEAGQGYKTEVTYNNESDRDIRFGVTSEDEMCITLGYYYN